MEQKKVSVIIPTFNRAKFLERGVRSIINQGYNNIEIIIVDDRSTDNTEAIVKCLTQKFSNIIYCKNYRGKGPSGARNTGIIKSSGEYIAFLDSDDIWLNGHLMNGIKILQENPDIDALFANSKVVDMQTGQHLSNFFDQCEILHSLKSVHVSPNIKVLQNNLFVALIQENFFRLGSLIVRKSTTNNLLLDESISFAEDRDFGIRLYKEANAKFAYRQDPVFIVYRHGSNLIRYRDFNTDKKIIKAHLYLFAKYLRIYDLSDIEKKILIKLISRRLVSLSYNYRMSKEYRNALVSILKSLKYSLSLDQFKELIKILITYAVPSKRLKI